MLISRFRVGVLTGLALVLAGCGEKSQTAADGGKGGKGGKGGGGPAPVLVTQVQKKVVPLVVDAIGSIEPIRTTAIRSQVTGTLMRIAIKEGQDVKQGDLLFEIDPRPFQNALQTAQADLQKARVQLETAHAQVTRYRTLTSEQMVSKEQFEKLIDTERSLEAEIQSDEAKVANAKVQLEYCSMHAPLDGRTGNLYVHEGDLVRNNATDATATLVTINQLSPIYATFGVPQQYLADINRYRSEGSLEVDVIPPGDNQKPERGELTFIDNTVDSTTGTIKLKGTFPNTSHRLWPGQFATVTVTLAKPTVLTIASSAIQNSQTGQHVYVVKADKTAELRPVVVQRTYESDTVISRGLTEGETVVTEGQLRVVPGRPVEVKQPDIFTKPGGGGRKGGEGKRGEGGKRDAHKGKPDEKA